jgi:hypothetical protein
MKTREQCWASFWPMATRDRPAHGQNRPAVPVPCSGHGHYAASAAMGARWRARKRRDDGPVTFSSSRRELGAFGV